MRRFIFHLLSLSLFLALAVRSPAQPACEVLTWNDSHRGEPLDLSGYHETFRDDFNTLDVTPDGGVGPWFAPVHGPFGAATFLPPDSNGPFSVANGVLTIRAQKDAERWTSGLMQTVDSQGRGFAQKFGYFEMRAQFPPGAGSWPAFWLLSQNPLLDKTRPHAEVDVVEFYGGDPKGDHMSVHLWPPQDVADPAVPRHVYHSFYGKLKSALVNGQLTGFHTYGAKLTPDWVIVYFDRRELARFPATPELAQPFYMVVDLAVFDQEAAAATSPKDLLIDYVTVSAPTDR